MTIARKFFALFVATALLLSTAMTIYVAQREYQVALDRTVEAAVARVMSRPDLQIHIYNRDEANLLQSLGGFLETESISLAIAYNNQGQQLATEKRSTVDAGQIPTLQMVRSEISVIDTNLTALDKQKQPAGTGFWSTLITEDPKVHLTTPVFSPVNPAARGLTTQDFMEALSDPALKGSLVVIGYMHLGIDRDVLLQAVLPHVYRTATISLLFLLLCAIVVFRVTGRITAPLSRLSDMAQRITSSEGERDTSIKKGDQFSDIESVLNRVLRDVINREDEIGLEHKLLLLRADESASKLSERDLELNKAEEEINAARQELHQAANYDQLTTLPNRHLFTEQLALLLRLCARDAKPMALLFLNLDNFNRINESLGRSAGDQLLREIGGRLVSCLRSSDILTKNVDSDSEINVSRLGGDEFAIVLNRLDKAESAGMVAQRVADNLARPITVDGHDVVVTPSIGIAIAPRDGMEVDELLGAANTAMQHAKSDKDNIFLFFSETMESARQDDLKMESALRMAIENRELQLHYQPQVDTANGSIVGAEALLRWNNPELGDVSPFRFVALAEKIGLIQELGDWVLVEACRQMKAFREEGIELPRMAINISPHQFNPAFVKRLSAILKAAGIPPSALELGLSEGILMDNDASTLKVLEGLKETGVYLSLENFGTSYAPLGYLSRRSLDEIKIDRSFVSNCDNLEDAGRLVNAIIAMVQSLGLRTVAEGVETEAEYRYLADRGVRIMRGYLFCKPVPAETLKEQLVVPWHYMTQLQRMTLTAEIAASAT